MVITIRLSFVGRLCPKLMAVYCSHQTAPQLGHVTYTVVPACSYSEKLLCSEKCIMTLKFYARYCIRDLSVVCPAFPLCGRWRHCLLTDSLECLPKSTQTQMTKSVSTGPYRLSENGVDDWASFLVEHVFHNNGKFTDIVQQKFAQQFPDAQVPYRNASQIS